MGGFSSCGGGRRRGDGGHTTKSLAEDNAFVAFEHVCPIWDMGRFGLQDEAMIPPEAQELAAQRKPGEILVWIEEEVEDADTDAS